MGDSDRRASLLVRRLWPVLGDAQGGAASQRAQEARLCCGGIALLVCLGPIVPAQVAGVVAAGALAALVYSFAVDLRWLVSNGH